VSLKSFGAHITTQVLSQNLEQIYEHLDAAPEVPNLSQLKQIALNMLDYLDARNTEKELAFQLRQTY
jgi:hypothetical protein